MKKVICLLLCVVMGLSLIACGEGSPVTGSLNTESGNQNNQTDATQSQNLGLNDFVAFKSLTYSATELQESKGNEFFKPEAGNIFVGIKFTIENTSSEAQIISSLLQFSAYVDDVKCDYSISAACAFDEGTLDGEVAAGKKLVGWYAVEVPENWSSIEIVVSASSFSSENATFVFTK